MSGRTGSSDEYDRNLTISYKRNTLSEHRHLIFSIPDRFRYSGKNDRFKMYLPGRLGLSDAPIIFEVKRFIQNNLIFYQILLQQK